MIKLIRSLFGSRTEVDFVALVKNGAVVIDVRTPEEFKQGHAKNSTNIPLNALPQKLAELKKKGKVVITVCRSGSRSGMAKSMLLRQGIEAYNGGPWNVFQQKITR